MEARQHAAAAAAVAVPVETWRRSCPRARKRQILRCSERDQICCAGLCCDFSESVSSPHAGLASESRQIEEDEISLGAISRRSDARGGIEAVEVEAGVAKVKA